MKIFEKHAATVLAIATLALVGPVVAQRSQTAAPANAQQGQPEAPANPQQAQPAAPAADQQAQPATPADAQQAPAAPANGQQGQTATPADAQQAQPATPADTQQAQPAAPASAQQGQAAQPASAQQAKAATPAYVGESHVGNLTGHAADGKKMYQRSCIGCHGQYGDGLGENAPYIDPKPRDFTAGTFKCRSTPTGSLPTDQDLYNSLERGFNTTNMPSWSPLTPQNRTDLVAYVKTFSPKFAKEKPDAPIQIPPETPVTIASIKHGNELFQKLECWKCHGPEGRGDGPSASTLTDSKDQPIRPYNFTSGSRFKCGSSNTDLYRIFMTGLDGTPMPSFADNIKPNDAWDLVHYLRTLQVTRKSPENEALRAAGGRKVLTPININGTAGGSGR